MVLKISRRTAVRAVCFSTAALLTLGGFAVRYRMQSEAQRLAMSAGWSHAFGELATSLNSIDIALRKGVVATGPMLATLTNEISRDTALALGAISSLPYSGREFENTSNFLSRLGDYAAYLSRVEAAGVGISEEERANLGTLSECATDLNQQIAELYSGVAEGSLTVGTALDFESIGSSVDVIGDAISEIELEFPEYPGLIYDGPFSEHISSATPKLTEGAQELSAEEAAERAAAIFGLDPALLTLTGEGGGSLPVYCFMYSGEGGDIYIDASRMGGYVVDMMWSRESDGENKLSIDECLNAARSFIESATGKTMKESYHIAENGILTVNFAFMQDDVIIYPDLVKVSVSMYDGAIVGMEARGFVMNHCQRELPTPAVSAEEARAALGDSLDVQSVRLAVIPSSGKYERLCYEFLCRTGESNMLVYVNAQTGSEEQILILVEDENGTLTI